MVNHFATLLANLNLLNVDVLLENYLLSDELSDLVITDTDYAIRLRDLHETINVTRRDSPLLNRNFIQLQLPTALQNFYQLLFPDETSSYYKQFLLYCYLRLIDAAGLSDSAKLYDNRISYDLDNIQDYFRYPRLSVPSSNSPNYNILVSGKLTQTDNVNYFVTSYTVSQIGNSASVLVYSPTQLKYYKEGMPPSSTTKDMAVQLELDPEAGNMTKLINIANTGISFRLTGPFNSSLNGFMTSSHKNWSFSAEAAFNFSLSKLFTKLDNYQRVVDNMLLFSRDSCDISYENMWTSHYNDVYRIAGLLLAYVQRVNQVWQKRAT